MIDVPAGAVDEGRRRFMLGMAGCAGALLLPAGIARAGFWEQPRSIDLYRVASGERGSCVYWRNGALDPVGYQQSCWMLRDVKAGEMVQMHPRLLDLLCAMQAWVGHFGFAGPLHVLSGYRNPRTNANTEGAAKNSMHMYGRAADIRFPGLPVSYLGQLAQRYAAGGVGFYIGKGFVHVDTGRVRSWAK